MKKILFPLLSLLFVAFSANVMAQTEAKPVLDQADIQRFIKTMKPMHEDFEKLGDKYEDIENPNVLQGMAANEEVKAIFTKHGWGNDFWVKFNAIAMGVYVVHLESVLDEIPEEQREAMKQMIDMQSAQVASSVAKSDIELVRKNFDELSAVMEGYD